MSIPHPKFDFAKQSVFAKRIEKKSTLRDQKSQSFSKMNTLHSQLESKLNLINDKSNKNIFTSPIDKLMTSMRRNILIKEPFDKNDSFRAVSDTLLKSPYINEEIKNKYSSLYIETCTNGSSKEAIQNYYSMNNYNSNNISRRSESINNKRREIYSLLSDGKEDSISEYKSKNEKKIKENDKISRARSHFDKLLSDSTNKKNVRPKMRYFIPYVKKTIRSNILTQRDSDKAETELNEFQNIFTSVKQHSRNNSKNKQEKVPFHQKYGSYYK